MDNETLKIAIGADHLGFDYKTGYNRHFECQRIKRFWHLRFNRLVDYPDLPTLLRWPWKKVNLILVSLFDGTANGVAITANKHKGIRAAICWSEEVAELARGHNNANILCIPARFVSLYETHKIVEVFLTTPFEGGRHATRVNKIAC